jgi:GntR family transcriptional regulator
MAMDADIKRFSGSIGGASAGVTMSFMETIREPLYRTAARKIKERISCGTYSAGRTLPAEPVLAREFGVSRITIRQALAVLKREGLLYSKSGVGTLVRDGGVHPERMRMTGSLEDLINYGAQTKYRSVDRELVTPPIEVAKGLGVSSTVKTFRFRGLRSRVGEKIAFGFEEVYIPEHLGQRLDNVALAGRTLFSMLEETNGLRVVDARQVITAVSSPGTLSRYLDIRERTPVLRVTRSYQVADGRTVEVAVSHYVPSRFEYIMTLYRE